jgi:hypothetical protein
MKTLVGKIGNDFNTKFTLSVETAQTEQKTYENYEKNSKTTAEMIASFVEIHGERNVMTIPAGLSWDNETEMIHIIVFQKVWECVEESNSLEYIRTKEKQYIKK